MGWLCGVLVSVAWDITRSRFGRTGCAVLPAQALLNSSHMFSEARDSFSHHGVLVSDLKFDWGVMQKQKNEAVSGLTKGIEGLFKKNKVSQPGHLLMPAILCACRQQQRVTINWLCVHVR